MLRVRYEPSKQAKQSGFAYQVDAVRTVAGLEFAALFHEQGLGKTKIAIDLALSWLIEDVLDSVLFLTKKSLIQNWCDELAVHTHLTPRILSQDRRANYDAFNSPARFYLAHYEACKSELTRLELFLKTRRVGVICDEAQKFKNPTGEIAKSLFKIAPLFKKRIVLTGTPIANRPYDIWALVRFLDGGAALGSDFEAFKANYDLTAELAHDDEARSEFETKLGALMPRIRAFTVRETKESAGLSLPGKEIIQVPVEIGGRQEELYARYRDELRSVVIRSGKPVVDDVATIVKRLLRLVQVASNPRLVDQSYGQIPAKLPALQQILHKALLEPSSKAIVWTTFTENVDWLARELTSFGPTRVHGKMAIAERNKSIQRFKTDAAYRVLIATPGAAKEGLTLTVANHAIFFDRSLSLDDYLQAQDRIHRISQSKPCYIYNLVATGTVDEWVNELLGAKQLAAKFALGDVSQSEYQQNATYDFVSVLRRILGEALGAEDSNG